MLASFSSQLRCLGLLAGVFLLSGCYREATDADGTARHAGTAPWNVAGVRPGQTLDEARRLFGEPRDIRGSGGVRVVHWATTETMVTADASGLVLEVWGRSLQAGGQSLITTGLNETQVEHILGRGKSTRISSPSGFVISFGSKTTGHIFTYQNDGVTFEITVKDQSVQHVRAYRPAQRD